jgi:hypothetical protein
MNERNFDEILEGTERTEWEAFRIIVDSFDQTQGAQLQTVS